MLRMDSIFCFVCFFALACAFLFVFVVNDNYNGTVNVWHNDDNHVDDGYDDDEMIMIVTIEPCDFWAYEKKNKKHKTNGICRLNMFGWTLLKSVASIIVCLFIWREMNSLVIICRVGGWGVAIENWRGLISLISFHWMQVFWFFVFSTFGDIFFTNEMVTSFCFTRNCGWSSGLYTHLEVRRTILKFGKCNSFSKEKC